uniref:TRAF-type domain-containing protein n=1 Tax=Macrostomum lignano TaxID=282301 RepID=A0A1I8GMY3_9PLAT
QNTCVMSELPQRVSGARPVSDLPAHLQCSSCSKPLFNARQTPHGCRLCQACVTGLLHEVEKRPCPGHTEACTLRDHHSEEDVGGGGEVEVEVSRATCFPDMATRREVAKLRVRCPNCDAGCSVQLEWARMDQHVQQSCDWHSLRCEQCKELILKKDMQRHTSSECRHRKETCDLCSQLVTHSEMETSHRNLQSDVCCPRFSARCPHCSERSTPMDRRGYVAHLSECPERPVECKYSHLGCRAMSSAGAAPPAPTAADGREVADVKRRVGSVFEQFKKLQVNVANWAHSTMELEQMADRREVAKLRVRCPNCDAGCSVQLEWARMDQHVQQSCDWHSLRCEQCKELILKKDMQRHTSSECRHRKETCDLCSQLVTHSEMETSHRNLQSDVCCPRFSARCPHCSERSTPMDKRGYVAHLSECPERPVECKYSHLGCRAMVRRSDLERHYRESVDSHLELMDSKLKQAAIAQQSPSAVPQSYVGSAAPAADGRDVADVKRRVGSVFEQFKKLQDMVLTLPVPPAVRWTVQLGPVTDASDANSKALAYMAANPGLRWLGSWKAIRDGRLTEIEVSSEGSIVVSVGSTSDSRDAKSKTELFLRKKPYL